MDGTRTTDVARGPRERGRPVTSEGGQGNRAPGSHRLVGSRSPLCRRYDLRPTPACPRDERVLREGNDDAGRRFIDVDRLIYLWVELWLPVAVGWCGPSGSSATVEQLWTLTPL